MAMTFAVFSIAGKNIENVSQWRHFGHQFSDSHNDADDINVKKTSFNWLRQYFVMSVPQNRFVHKL
jgi:hypothetical protein